MLHYMKLEDNLTRMATPKCVCSTKDKKELILCGVSNHVRHQGKEKESSAAMFSPDFPSVKYVGP